MEKGKNSNLKKYKRRELLELLIEQRARIEQLEAELDAACRALAQRDREAESAAASPLDAAQRCAARESARTVLFDLMGLMQILERTDESSEEAN